METESLTELTQAFKAWRRKKRHVREAVPVTLLERACQAIDGHGLGPVARAAKLERARLEKVHADWSRRRKRRAAVVPPYSRVVLGPAATTTAPFAELETPAGLKLRLYTQTPQVIDILSSVCATGGGQ